jgi:hypothetical protein
MAQGYQWYTMEKIGDVVHDPWLILTINLACCFRLLSIWSDSSSYRFNPRVCICNRSKWRTMPVLMYMSVACMNTFSLGIVPVFCVL